jgi:hypothetical protein
MGTGYAGTVTQSEDFGCTDFLMQAGTFTGVFTKTLTCSGNFTKTGGTITTNVLVLKMTGESKTVTNAVALRSLQASANISVVGSSTRSYLIVDSGKTLDIPSGSFVFSYGGSNGITNNGVISGSGTFQIEVLTSFSQALGVIQCPLLINGHASMADNRIITLSGNLASTNTLTISSASATYTLTLATSTYTLTCGALTLGDRGCLSQTGTAGNVTCTSYTQSGTGSVLTGKVDATFTCSGNATQTAGTIIAEKCKWVFSGNGSTISLVATAHNTIQFGANVYWNGASGGAVNIVVDVDKTVTINSGKNLVWYQYYSNPSISNNGFIDSIGTGQFWYLSSTSHNLVNVGKIKNIYFIRANVAGSNCIITATYVLNACGSVKVESGHATYTCTLDLAGYSFSCASLIVGTRGILLGGEGSTSLNGGAFDSSAGTFTKETSSVVLNGNSTLKTNGTDEFHNLITTGVRTLASNITVGHYYVHARDEVLAGFTLSLTDATLEKNAWEIHPVVNPVVNPVMTGTNYCLRYIGR